MVGESINKKKKNIVSSFNGILLPSIQLQ